MTLRATRILTEIKFFSDTLGFHTSMHVVLPKRTLAEMQSKRKPKYRTLYLLHGHSDDHTAWQRFTSIERYAEGLNLVVGLSMGGYGAFKMALTHPERFAAASLSGATDINEVVRIKKNEPDNEAWIEEMRTVFGNLSKVSGSGLLTSPMKKGPASTTGPTGTR